MAARLKDQLTAYCPYSRLLHEEQLTLRFARTLPKRRSAVQQKISRNLIIHSPCYLIANKFLWALNKWQCSYSHGLALRPSMGNSFRPGFESPITH
ncbi:hypothetical protein O181_079657 [Austropuccinia psidii MF-1]|uniref:Uncharacterized protein n=1 Tax=Austropuccinia psidii MF-1 TaxID=1389203 RepID=A0A9Q3FMH1_9BASI|nr:hypothetical protein [Austropuccinia psidii MF-1]